MAKSELGKINLHNTLESSRVHTKQDFFNGAYYLADTKEMSQYFEPQRANTFKFVVNDLNIDLTSFGHAAYGYAVKNAAQNLELAVKSSSVPHFDINPITINRGNSQMKFAGKPTFKDGQITIHDYIGAYAKDVLLAWQRQAYEVRTQKVGLAKDYKREGALYELTPDFQIVREWQLHGCWISSVSEGNYDYSSDEAKTVDATLVFDYAEPVLWNTKTNP